MSHLTTTPPNAPYATSSSSGGPHSARFANGRQTSWRFFSRRSCRIGSAAHYEIISRGCEGLQSIYPISTIVEIRYVDRINAFTLSGYPVMLRILTFQVFWSGCRESNPAYMHPMHAYCRYTTPRPKNLKAGALWCYAQHRARFAARKQSSLLALRRETPMDSCHHYTTARYYSYLSTIKVRLPPRPPQCGARNDEKMGPEIRSHR